MKTYAAGYTVTLTFDLVDADGNEITPTGADFEIFDEEGNQIDTGSLTVTGSETELPLSVPSNLNSIGSAERYGARTVVLNVQTSKGTVQLQQTYVLERAGFLSIPAQSGQTLQNAMILAMQMDQDLVQGWEYAEDREREAALIEAWNRLCRVGMVPWRPDETIPDTFDTKALDNRGRLDELPADQFNLLPSHFRRALKRAQLTEAAVILDGDPTWDRRVDGLISKTVGESSEFFRSAKPILNPVSPKAMKEISSYVQRRVTFQR